MGYTYVGLEGLLLRREGLPSKLYPLLSSTATEGEGGGEGVVTTSLCQVEMMVALDHAATTPPRVG